MRRVGAVQWVVRRVGLHGHGLHSRKRDGREKLVLLLVLLLLVMLLELMLLVLLLLLVMLLELNVWQGHGVLLTLLVQQVVDPHNFARCRRFHIVLTGWRMWWRFEGKGEKRREVRRKLKLVIVWYSGPKTGECVV